MAKSAQSPILTTWNKLSFVNKVYSVLFLFLLVAMAISIPFVAGDKSLGDTRSKAASGGSCYKKVGASCPGGWESKAGQCLRDVNDPSKGTESCSMCCPPAAGSEEGQGGGGEAGDPGDGASGGNPCDVPGAQVEGCDGAPGAGGGGGGVGAIVESIKKAVTKPNRETMQAICPFILDYIDESGLPQTASEAGMLKKYLKAHNTEYRGWGKIDQFSGSEIYRFGKKYCPDFPVPTPTPAP